jgi:excisionase family DNA binding protein
MTERQVLTPAQASRLLGLGKTTILDWCAKGVLPHVRIDSRVYLKRAELIRDGWLTPSTQEGAPAGTGAQGGFHHDPDEALNHEV